MSGLIINKVAGLTTRPGAQTVTITADDVMLAKTPALIAVIDGRTGLAVASSPADPIGNFNHADAWDARASYGCTQGMLQRPIFANDGAGRPALQFGFGGSLAELASNSGTMRAVNAALHQLPAGADYSVDMIVTARPGKVGAWIGSANRDTGVNYFMIGYNTLGRVLLRHSGAGAGGLVAGVNADIRDDSNHHVRVTYNHAEHTAKIFVDGVLSMTKTDMDAAGITAGDAGQTLVIGGTTASTGIANDLHKGLISRILICGVDLSAPDYARFASALRASAVSRFGTPA